MKGLPAHNFPAFDAMAKKLRMEGHAVFSPAEHDREEGFDCSGLSAEAADKMFPGGLSSNERRMVMADDSNFICLSATHIYMLEGWSKSLGATAERALALALGVVVEGAPA